jgi:Protein of unknown function (DUF3102)
MEIVAIGSNQVARPLRVLVPLIKEDLAGAERAGLPFKQAAGFKLLEAKGQVRHGEWGLWLRNNFTLSAKTARVYMDFAEKTNKGGIPPFSSMNAFHKETGSSHYRSVTSKRTWHEPVKEAIAKVNVDALKQDALAKQEERALQRKLALSLIDIGFKALASKLHPDKGGSREAMVRLNRVRELLQQAVPA